MLLRRGVPARSRRLLCRQGHGEGDPYPGAAQQEPHPHRHRQRWRRLCTGALFVLLCCFERNMTGCTMYVDVCRRMQTNLVRCCKDTDDSKSNLGTLQNTCLLAVLASRSAIRSVHNERTTSGINRALCSRTCESTTRHSFLTSAK